MIRKAIEIDWLTQLKPLAPTVLPSLAMCGVLYGVMTLFPELSTFTMLLLKIALGGSIYVLLLVALERPLLIQLLSRSTPAAG